MRVGAGRQPDRLVRVIDTVDRLSVGRLTVALDASGEFGRGDPIDDVLDSIDAAWSDPGGSSHRPTRER